MLVSPLLINLACHSVSDPNAINTPGTGKVSNHKFLIVVSCMFCQLYLLGFFTFSQHITLNISEVISSRFIYSTPSACFYTV